MRYQLIFTTRLVINCMLVVPPHCLWTRPLFVLSLFYNTGKGVSFLHVNRKARSSASGAYRTGHLLMLLKVAQLQKPILHCNKTNFTKIAQSWKYDILEICVWSHCTRVRYVVYISICGIQNFKTKFYILSLEIHNLEIAVFFQYTTMI